MTVTAVVRARLAHEIPLDTIADIGCGTGVGGAAWAAACTTVKPPVDRRRRSECVGRAGSELDLQDARPARPGEDRRRRPQLPEHRRGGAAKTAVLLAYTVNELPADTRALLLDRVSQSTRAGARLLIVEPIARGVTTWWDEWTARLAPDGARADEWRFPRPCRR